VDHLRHTFTRLHFDNTIQKQAISIQNQTPLLLQSSLCPSVLKEREREPESILVSISNIYIDIHT